MIRNTPYSVLRSSGADILTGKGGPNLVFEWWKVQMEQGGVKPHRSQYYFIYAVLRGHTGNDLFFRDFCYSIAILSAASRGFFLTECAARNKCSIGQEKSASGIILCTTYIVVTEQTPTTTASHWYWALGGGETGHATAYVVPPT
jgi:hypothetical protein